MRRGAEKRLNSLLERARKARIRHKGLLLRGLPHEEIASAAKSKKADLVVVGTHGRTGMARVFLGSVAARVISSSLARFWRFAVDRNSECLGWEETMRLREIMKTRVESISPNESAEAAANRMRSARIRHLVVQDGKKIVGVVSDRDIGRLGSFRQIETVEEVMSAPVVTASPDSTLREAANLLRGQTIGCLPVMERGKLVGIVTITDVLALVGRGAERPVPKSRRGVMKGRGSRRKAVVER